MSGTSMDGLDMCLSEINLTEDYNLSFKIVKTAFSPFDEKIKKMINNALKGNGIELSHENLGKLYKKKCNGIFYK